MNWSRYTLIIITLVFAAILTVPLYTWSAEYKDTFFYSGDWISYIMVFVFVIALAGIFKWFLKEEIILTNPKRKRRKKK